MNETILTALIMAGASIICQLLINHNNRKRMEIEDAVKDANLQNKLHEIERKLDEHNEYASKIGSMRESLSKLATAIAVIETEVKHLTKGV